MVYCQQKITIFADGSDENMRIFTVTLNPAFDIHYEMNSLTPGTEQYARRVIREAGGKGINTARALTANGVENTAYAVIGEENAPAFLTLLEKDGVTCRPVYVPGAIRENITLHPDHQPETRISLNTFTLDPSVLNTIYDMLTADGNAGDLLSFAGRVPRGITGAQVCSFLARLSRFGFRLIVDSNSMTRAQLAEIRPWLIKPNESELTALCGVGDPLDQARQLVGQQAAQQVLVTLGGAGSLFCTADFAQWITVPRLENPVSTIGAGDSTIAGFLAAVRQGLPREEWAPAAAAWGTAACMTEGTRPPRPADIRKIMASVVKEYA